MVQVTRRKARSLGVHNIEVREFVPSPPPDPAAPGPFRLAPPGELERVLRAAGFSGIAIQSLPLTFNYGSVLEYWEAQADLSVPLRAALGTLKPDEAARLKAAVLDAIKPHVGKSGSVQFTVVPLCAVATA